MKIFFLFAQNYFHFVLISIVAGLGFAFQSGCMQAMVYDSLKEEGREGHAKKSFGTIGAFFQAGHILGAFVSSLIITSLLPFEITRAIIFTIVAVGISLVISLFLNEPKGSYERSEESPLKMVAETFTLIRKNPSLKRIILLGLFTTPFIGYLRNFQPPYFQVAHVAPVWLGFSLTIGGIIAVLASKYAYKFEGWLGVTKGLLLATIFPGLLYLLMALVLPPALTILLFTLPIIQI